jgi:hypothetical protein
MKLKLEKQKITRLSSEDMDSINGGGRKRSNRNNGGCNYSRNHAVQAQDIKKDWYIVSCKPKSVAMTETVSMSDLY